MKDAATSRRSPNLRDGSTLEHPVLLSIAGHEVLAYEGEKGIRVAAWKHQKGCGDLFVEYEIQDTPREIAVRRFRTIHELEDVLRTLLP
jgi:hypothetical protein